MPARYRNHSVLRENRPDGSIILRSGYEMSRPARVTGDWLHQWAETSADRVFIAERSGAGWRELTYLETLQRARSIAAALLGRGFGPDTRIMVISGNSVQHGLLALAAQYIGAPIVPVAEQYALIHGTHARLRHALDLVRPKMIYAEDGRRFAEALQLAEVAARAVVVAKNATAGQIAFSELLKGDAAADIDKIHAQIGPDDTVKILLTSGSTSNPKGVITTHKMMCSNQAQIADAFPFLGRRPPVIVDWLPWSHTFGGSYNFNMVLANGGSLYIDDGKPLKGLVDRTIENLGLVQGNIWFNVPVGFAMVAEAMRADTALRNTVFADLDMLFYAGASLPQEVWASLEKMALAVRPELPLMTSSWGLTESAPGALVQHEPIDRSGIVGVPMTGVTVKLLPDEDMRCEIRLKGPNITPGYLGDAEQTRAAFDEEGFFLTGDAMKFVDPQDVNKGLKFDGRIAEDFKLLSGTWVRAANLRLEMLDVLDGLASDLVLTGADRAEIGVLIFPAIAALSSSGFDTVENDGALTGEALAHEIEHRLAERARRVSGSASEVRRALVLSDPPSIGDSEMTAKGNLNFRVILKRRARLLERLYDDDDPATITV